MRYSQISEAPIADLETLGIIPDKGLGSEMATSHRLHNNEKGRAKIFRAFEKTDYIFNFYLVQSEHKEDGKAIRPFITKGLVDKDKVKKYLGKDIDTEGKISILFTNNVSNDDRPLGAWMLAHRVSHPVQMSKEGMEIEARISAVLNRVVNAIASTQYSDRAPIKINMGFRNSSTGYYQDIINQLFTMKSARNGIIGDRLDVDGMGELMAQYLITGKVRFNHIEGHEKIIQKGEAAINKLIKTLFDQMVGKIYSF